MEKKVNTENPQKLDPEYLEMVSKSVYKLYKPEDKKKLGMEPTKREPVYSQATWTLYRYPCEGASRHKPLVIVPSLINRPYILDLLKGHSIIENFVAAGLDVYLVDWGWPEEAYGHIGFAHYAEKFINRAIRHVKKMTGAEKVNLMGQCLGGTMTAAYAAHPALKKNIEKLALLTTPINFENSGLLSKWTNPETFDIYKLTAAIGPIVPPDFFHSSFPLLNVRNTMAKYKNLLEKFEIADFKKIWQALDIWAAENVPFTLNAFRDLIKVLYQENRLYKGNFFMEDVRVGALDIDVPTLSVVAKEDHVFTESAAAAILESKAAKAKKLEYHVMPAGHVSLIVAHPVRTETYKIFTDFLTSK